jgi:hypothetical protein
MLIRNSGYLHPPSRQAVLRPSLLSFNKISSQWVARNNLNFRGKDCEDFGKFGFEPGSWPLVPEHRGSTYGASNFVCCLQRLLLSFQESPVFTTGDRSSSATREPMDGRLSSTFLHEILFVFCLTVGLVGLSKRWNFLGRPGSYTLHSGLLSFYWRLDPRLDSVLLLKPKWWHNSVAEVQM